MKKFNCVKVDKATNIVITEKGFNTLESAKDFISQIAAAFDYKPSNNPTFMYENEKSGLTIR